MSTTPSHDNEAASTTTELASHLGYHVARNAIEQRVQQLRAGLHTRDSYIARHYVGTSLWGLDTRSARTKLAEQRAARHSAAVDALLQLT